MLKTDVYRFLIATNLFVGIWMAAGLNLSKPWYITVVEIFLGTYNFYNVLKYLKE